MRFLVVAMVTETISCDYHTPQMARTVREGSFRIEVVYVGLVFWLSLSVADTLRKSISSYASTEPRHNYPSVPLSCSRSTVTQPQDPTPATEGDSTEFSSAAVTVSQIR